MAPRTIHLDWDFVVVGAGVAGSTAAGLLADLGYRVGLLERGAFEKQRIGEVIPYHLLKWLFDNGRLDLFEHPEVLGPAVGFRTLWGNKLRRLEEEPTSTHLRIDRVALDRCLFDSALKRGANGWMEARVHAANFHDDRWQIEFEQNGQSFTASAGFALEATGRSRYSPLSTNRQRLFEDKHMACALRMPSDQVRSWRDHVWIESHAQGWWYLSQLPERECLVVFFTDRDLLPRTAQQRSTWLWQQWQTTQACQELFVSSQQSEPLGVNWTWHDARMSLRHQSFGTGWIAIGDAQLALDPLSGQGIAASLRSARDAVAFLSSHSDWRQLDWPAWADTVATQYNQYRWQRIAQYRRETDYLDSTYWHRRHHPEFSKHAA